MYTEENIPILPLIVLLQQTKSFNSKVESAEVSHEINLIESLLFQSNPAACLPLLEEYYKA